jgi:hypothetical protein
MNDSHDVGPLSPTNQEKFPQQQRGPKPAGIWSLRLFLASVLFVALVFVHGLDDGAYFYISSSAICAVLGFVYGWKDAESWPGKVGLLGSCLILVVFVVPLLYFMSVLGGSGLHED